MVAGILLISVIPICYPEGKDWNTQDFKFACSWLVPSLSGEPEEKRPRVYVDGDNAKMDLKEVW